MKIKEENKERIRKGIIITTIVHVVAIILFFILGFEVVEPKSDYPQIVWEMKGDPNAGNNSPEPATSENPSKTPQEEKQSSASQKAVDDQKVISDDNSATPIKTSKVNSKKKKDPKKVTTKKTPKETKSDEEKVDDAIQKALDAAYKGKKNPGGPGSDPGNPGGATDGDSPDPGGPSGGGDKYSIGNRKAIKIGSQNNDCGKVGEVIIRVTVNRAGSVIKVAHVDGNTMNSCLINQAKAFAKQIKYAAKQGGPATNEGNIKIKYSLN